MGDLLQSLKDFIFWERFKLNNKEYRKENVLNQWKNEGEQVPPPHELKQKVIKDFQQKYSINILVETGTFRGEMVFAQKDNFKTIYSIELSEALYKTAKKRLNKYNNVKLYCGDSTAVLPEILRGIDEPSIFWLDGHYSGFETAKGSLVTPVNQELEVIFESSFEHVILIDDARLFNGKNDYPDLKEFKSGIEKKWTDYTVNVEHDIIRILPRIK